MNKHKTIWDVILKSRWMPVGVIVLVTLLFGTALYAGADSSFKSMVADSYGKALAEKTEPIDTADSGDEMLGSVDDARPARLYTMQYGKVNYDFLFGTGIDMNNATTTNRERLDANTRISLNFQKATSTVEGELLRVLGSKQNTGADLLVCGTITDLQGNQQFGSFLSIGTTTCATAGATCGDGVTSFVATTTGGILNTTYRATSTEVVWNRADNTGSDSRDCFVWKNGEWINVTESITEVNATSSDSLTAKGGNTSAGTVHLITNNRY